MHCFNCTVVPLNLLDIFTPASDNWIKLTFVPFDLFIHVCSSHHLLTVSKSQQDNDSGNYWCIFYYTEKIENNICSYINNLQDQPFICFGRWGYVLSPGPNFFVGIYRINFFIFSIHQVIFPINFGDRNLFFRINLS